MQNKSAIIGKLNQFFGDSIPASDQIAFVNHIADIIRENGVEPLEIDLPGAIQQSATLALARYQTLSTFALKSDPHSLAHIVYDRLTH